LFQDATTIRAGSFFRSYNVKRVILLKPGGAQTSLEFQFSDENISGSIEDFRKKLDEICDENGDRKIKTDFYDGVISNSTIICNKSSRSGIGWAQVEISYPYSTVDERPIMVVKQSKNPALFMNICKQFDSIIQAIDRQERASKTMG
jgi:hypothetical protein